MSGRRRCPKCDTSVEVEFSFCPLCGYDFTDERDPRAVRQTNAGRSVVSSSAKLLAGAVLIVAVAGAGAVAVSHWHDRDAGATAQTETTYDKATLELAVSHKVPPAVMAERLKIATATCDVFRIVRAGYEYLANACRLNIVRGDPWWDHLQPRQLRDVTKALTLAAR